MTRQQLKQRVEELANRWMRGEDSLRLRQELDVLRDTLHEIARGADAAKSMASMALTLQRVPKWERRS